MTNRKQASQQFLTTVWIKAGGLDDVACVDEMVQAFVVLESIEWKPYLIWFLFL